MTSGFKFQPKHKHIDPKTQKFLWRVDPAVNTYLFGGGVLLQHRQIQPLWRKTETRTCYRMVHESSSFMLVSLSHRAYYLHETQLNLTGSIIVQLFESVCCKKKKKYYKMTLFLHDCREEIWPRSMRTHWRVTPSESGSTQSCQSQWWGFVRCSGPRWSDAGGCWERSLCKCKNQKN